MDRQTIPYRLYPKMTATDVVRTAAMGSAGRLWRCEHQSFDGCGALLTRASPRQGRQYIGQRPSEPVADRMPNDWYGLATVHRASAGEEPDPVRNGPPTHGLTNALGSAEGEKKRRAALHPTQRGRPVAALDGPEAGRRGRQARGT